MTEIVFKILIVGDAQVGKTSFVQRYVHDAYPKNYKETLGADFALKVIKWSETETVRLQFWDIAGQERFQSMTRVYYKKASACVIMFDITQPGTFLSTIKWKRDLDTKCTLPDGSPIPCILVANKIDLARVVQKEEINKFCKDYNFLGWTEMSVRDNKHVTETMDYLVDELMSPLHGCGGSHKNEEQHEHIHLSDESVEDSRKCCGFS